MFLSYNGILYSFWKQRWPFPSYQIQRENLNIMAGELMNTFKSIHEISRTLPRPNLDKGTVREVKVLKVFYIYFKFISRSILKVKLVFHDTQPDWSWVARNWFSQLLAFFMHLVYFGKWSNIIIRVVLLIELVLHIEVVLEEHSKLIHIQITLSYIDTWRGLVEPQENRLEYIKEIQQKFGRNRLLGSHRRWQQP